LILRKIIKIVATIYYILKIYCTTFDFGCGSNSDLYGGARIIPLGLWLDVRHSPSKKREWKERRTEREGEKEKGKKEKENRKESRSPISHFCMLCHCQHTSKHAP